MKFICLGYMAEKKSEAMSGAELNAALAECFEYDVALRRTGHLIGGEVLQSPRNAATLRWRSGKLSVTQGPFAGRKAQLAGILSLQVADLSRAIRLMSKHPSVRMGMCWEIRPAADMSPIVARGARRRSIRKAKAGKGD
jgi:hypothetical protein